MVDEKVVSQDTHKVDYAKVWIAFDLERNGKDQTFDRDKLDEVYDVIENCNCGPCLELIARHQRDNWHQWSNEIPLESRDSSLCDKVETPTFA